MTINHDNVKDVDRAVYDAATEGDIYQGSASALALSMIELKWIESKIREVKNGRGWKLGLEIGCGGGDSLPWLANYCDFVLGLDHSMKAARSASNSISDKEHYAIVQADAENVPLKENSVNIVFCGSILHHLPEYQKSLSILYDCLAKNGVLAATEPCAYNPFAVIRRRYFPSIFHTPDERPFPPSEFISVFRRIFDKVHYRRRFIFSINAAVVERFLGRSIALFYLKVSMILDDLLLCIPFVRDLCWRIDIVGVKSKIV